MGAAGDLSRARPDARCSTSTWAAARRTLPSGVAGDVVAPAACTSARATSASARARTGSSARRRSAARCWRLGRRRRRGRRTASGRARSRTSSLGARASPAMLLDVPTRGAARAPDVVLSRAASASSSTRGGESRAGAASATSAASSRRRSSRPTSSAPTCATLVPEHRGRATVYGVALHASRCPARPSTVDDARAARCATSRRRPPRAGRRRRSASARRSRSRPRTAAGGCMQLAPGAADGLDRVRALGARLRAGSTRLPRDRVLVLLLEEDVATCPRRLRHAAGAGPGATSSCSTSVAAARRRVRHVGRARRRRRPRRPSTACDEGTETTNARLTALADIPSRQPRPDEDYRLRPPRPRLRASSG